MYEKQQTEDTEGYSGQAHLETEHLFTCYISKLL
jgi:hypothetical protein